MRYYAHYGHTEFILCLGFGAKTVKDYFLDYQETESNDFVLSKAGPSRMLSTDISDWRITFVDTGLHTRSVSGCVGFGPTSNEDEVFLANYGDVLTDAPAQRPHRGVPRTRRRGSLLAVPPPGSFHVVTLDEAGAVYRLPAGRDMNLRINGGFFVLRQEIFDSSTRARTSSWTPAAGRRRPGG